MRTTYYNKTNKTNKTSKINKTNRTSKINKINKVKLLTINDLPPLTSTMWPKQNLKHLCTPKQ